MKRHGRKLFFLTPLLVLSCIILVPIPRSRLQTPKRYRQSRERSLEEVRQDYLLNYAGTEVSHALWSGSIEDCEPGEVPPAVHERVLRRWKFFRRMAGVPDDVSFDPEFNRQAQACALISAANGKLDHHPSFFSRCSTSIGRDGCGRSNLSLGRTATRSLTGQMQDEGENNGAVGHRRWLLDPELTLAGHGSTSFSATIFVHGKYFLKERKQRDVLPEFIAWPPAGYVPDDLVFPRWSFSVDEGDFAQAKVVVTDGKGMPIPVSFEKQKQGYGYNTIVWRLTGPVSQSAEYHVSVTGVKQFDTAQNYTYTVRPVHIQAVFQDSVSVPAAKHTVEWKASQCTIHLVFSFFCAPEDVIRCAGAIQSPSFTTDLEKDLSKDLNVTLGETASMQEARVKFSRAGITDTCRRHLKQLKGLVAECYLDQTRFNPGSNPPGR